MTYKELSKNAFEELMSIYHNMKQSVKNSTNEKWKCYLDGKADGITMTINMMTNVDLDNPDNEYDSRDPAHIFTECKVGCIHFTLQVNESNVNAVVATLIDNKYRVVIKNIYEISENMTTWEIEYWKE